MLLPVLVSTAFEIKIANLVRLNPDLLIIQLLLVVIIHDSIERRHGFRWLFRVARLAGTAFADTAFAVIILVF